MEIYLRRRHLQMHHLNIGNRRMVVYLKEDISEKTPGYYG